MKFFTDNLIQLPIKLNVPKPVPKPGESGEIVEEIPEEEKFPEAYFNFIDSLQHYYHLSHSIRLVDLSIYKKLTNWPHCSPKQPKTSQKPLITAKEAYPMEIDLPTEKRTHKEPQLGRPLIFCQKFL